MNKKLLLGLGTISTITLPAIVVSCSFVNPPKPSTKPETPGQNGSNGEITNPDNPSKPQQPPISGPDFSTEIISTLPKEKFDPKKPKAVALGRLVKYVLEIHRIKDENGQNILPSKQREKYKEVMEYIIGKSSLKPDHYGNSTKGSFAYNAYKYYKDNENYQIDVTDLLKMYKLNSRIFFGDNTNWEKEFVKDIEKVVTSDYAQLEIISYMLLAELHTHAKAMNDIGRFLFYYAKYKIALIDANNQRGSAKNYFINNNQVFEDVQNAISSIREYLDPTLGAILFYKKDYIFSHRPAEGITKTDNELVFKYIVKVLNNELLPFAYFINKNNMLLQIYETEPKAYQLNYRNVKTILTNLTKEAIKYDNDFNNEEQLKATWAKMFNSYKIMYLWQFETA